MQQSRRLTAIIEREVDERLHTGVFVTEVEVPVG